MPFEITSQPISVVAAPDSHTGAVVTFDGIVRDLNDGLPVQALEYEAFEPLAVAEGERILTEARGKFGLVDVTCVHRVGRLAIGDVAVRVIAFGVHRREAFEACEYVIDEVKARVPIWKKEHYASGDSGWINAQKPIDEAPDPRFEAEYYARQMRLPQVGEAGQQKLRESRILVVGAGGLGSPALLYLAAAGVGTIGIADDDSVDLSNLHRQILYAAQDFGKPKASLAAARLQALNPSVRYVTHQERVSSSNSDRLLEEYDLVLDGSDNFQTKFLLNAACVRAGKPLIAASIYQFEGQLLTVLPEGEGGCLSCLWPETPAADCVGSCADVGVLGAVPGVLGAMQAVEALKMLLELPVPSSSALLTVDLMTGSMHRLRRTRNPLCPVCGSGEAISEGLEIEAKGWSDLTWFRVVDIRELHETPEITGVERMPLSEFDPFGVVGRTVLVCASGRRSLTLARQLRADGFADVFSLVGGVRDNAFLRTPP